MRRVVHFAPHYAEYAARMALEMAKTAKILLIVDRANRRQEIDGPLFEDLARAVTVFEFRSHDRLRRRLSRLAVLARIFRFRPDVIHVQEQPDPLTATVVAIARHWFPIVLTVHDPQPHGGRDAAYAARWDRFRMRIRSAAEVRHVHGAFCAALMRSVSTFERPIVSTPHGVVLTPRPDQIRPPKSHRILLFGRMEQYKGLDVLLEAGRVLTRRGLFFELVLAGRGPELDRLGPDIAGMAQAIVLNRYLAPAEAIGEFQRAAIVVVPYHEATQSGVVAAAFANGRPVVAARVGGLVDVVEDGVNGLLIPPGSAADLADALEGLLHDPARLARLSEGAVETGREKLGWGDICQSLSASYESVIAARAGR